MPTSRENALKRTLWPLALAALLMAASGCGTDPKTPPPAEKPKTPVPPAEVPRAGDQKVTMTWQGKPREYTVHAPP